MRTRPSGTRGSTGNAGTTSPSDRRRGPNTASGTWAAISALLLGAALAVACGRVARADAAPAPSAPPRAPEIHLNLVRLEDFRAVSWRPRDNYFKTDDPIRILLEDRVSHEWVELLADDAEGTLAGDIVVRGNLRLQRPEGQVSGRALSYRSVDQTGTILDASAASGAMSVRGQKIEMLPGQRLKATHASFTTCSCEHPDYHVTAREIVISPDGRVSAKHIGFFVGRTRLFSLPTFTRNFRQQSQAALPIMPSYTSASGIQARLRDQLMATSSSYLAYSVLLSLKRSAEGAVEYERDLGKPRADDPPPQLHVLSAAQPLRGALESSPPLVDGSGGAADQARRGSLFGLLHVSQGIYNRDRTDLRVSRLPEIGYAARNLLNRQVSDESPASNMPPAESAFGKGIFSPARWMVNAEAGVGWFREHPTDAKHVRFGGRADATSPLFRVIDPVYFRYGGVLTSSVYDNGQAYSILSPEIEADVFLRRDTFIGAAFRYAQEFGDSPFLFDRRDVRNEMRLRYGYLGRAWAWDLSVNYDLDRVRAYDTLVSIRRRFDCMEVGLAYQTRAQGLSMVFNLLPGSRTTAAKRPSERGEP